MGKRGPKPKWRKFIWSPNLAYAVGLFATDGCLYSDGRHLSLVSMDMQQLLNFKKAFGLKTTIAYKNNKVGKRCPHIQLSDVALYQFLESLGLTPNKSKTIGKIKIPPKYFFDFFRGVLDGDGCFYSYYDPRWRSSFMFYLCIASASPRFIEWLRTEIEQQLGIRGHITSTKGRSCSQLKYAKADSLKILKKVYYSPTVLCLSRKRTKILKALKSQGLDI
ncbi:MAG: hypothetical protein KGI73_02060 [Patescibacteria group bacterium]|nr:hypothetical protein [Patescibacteria group bacterium]